MYTQCPQCRTHFQVTTAHLKVAQGNVRCGQCRNVFNALGNLSEIPPDGADSSENNAASPSSAEKRPNPSGKDVKPQTDNITIVDSTETMSGAGLTQAIEAMRALNQASAKRLQKLHEANTGFVSKLKQQLDSKNTQMRNVDSHDSTAPDLSKQIAEPEFRIEDEPEIVAESQLDTIEVTDQDQDINFDEAFRAIDELDSLFADDNVKIQEKSKKQTKKTDTPNIEDDDDIRPTEDATHLVKDYAIQETYVNKLNTKKNKVNNAPGKKDTRKEQPVKKTQQGKQGKNAKPAVNKKQNSKATPSAKNASVETISSEFDDVSSLAQAIEEQNADDLFLSQPTVVEPPLATNIVEIPEHLLEEVEHDNISHAHLRSNTLWGAGSLALMFLFLFQTVYFKHNELGQISALRPWVESFCKRTNCRLEFQSDLSKLELLGQDIRSHPNIKNALLVSATIINNAKFVQRFPGLTLSFSDLNGEKVASRNFLPKDYVKKGTDTDQGMKPNTPVHFDLEMLDPGNKAVNFEFDFFVYK